jgi:hypothetical protein
MNIINWIVDNNKIMISATKGIFKFGTKKLFVGANWKSNNTKLQAE